MPAMPTRFSTCSIDKNLANAGISDRILRRMVTFFAVLMGLLPIFSDSSYGQSQQKHSRRMRETMEGTSASWAKRQGQSLIPYSKMQPAAQRKVRDIVENSSIYRRLPVTTIESDPDMHLFAVRYPEVIVNIWRLMGITDMSVQRTGTYRLRSDDASGTKTNIELIYGTPNLHIYYAEGHYEGPALMRKVSGRCIGILKTEYFLDANGKPKATNQFDVFLKIDHLAANLVAKTVYPLVGSTADHNFVETLRFVERLHETTAGNGPGVQRMAGRLDQVHPQVQKRFSEIAGAVFEKYGMSRIRQRRASMRPPVSNAPPKQHSRHYSYNAQQPNASSGFPRQYRQSQGHGTSPGLNAPYQSR